MFNAAEDEEAVEGGEGGEDGEASQGGEVKERDIIDTFKHIHVPEVVREKRMHFQRVPKLGAFMAIPLVY